MPKSMLGATLVGVLALAVPPVAWSVDPVDRDLVRSGFPLPEITLGGDLTPHRTGHDRAVTWSVDPNGRGGVHARQ